MNYFKPLLVLGIAGFALSRILQSGSIDRAPGELAPDEPRQELLDDVRSIAVGEFTLQPLASYDIEARVLSVERYRADAGAKLSPIDFAVGWGAMSDTESLQHFRVTQGARYYTIYPDDQALDLPRALRSSANMHLIPANDGVRDALLSTRPGNIVT